MPSKNNQSFQQKSLRSPCPIAGALDVIGDRWTLLVVRDIMLLDKRRFNEFAGSWEKIPTNILSDRLKRLEAYGIIEKVPYQDNPVRHEYKLTQAGEDLKPAIQELMQWGLKHIPGTGTAK